MRSADWSSRCDGNVLILGDLDVDVLCHWAVRPFLLTLSNSYSSRNVSSVTPAENGNSHTPFRER
jgi:hypothetical protein